MRWEKLFIAVRNEDIYMTVSGCFSLMQLRRVMKNGWREAEWQNGRVGEWLHREMGAKGATAVEGKQWTYPGAQGVGHGGGLQLGTGREWEHRGAREVTGRMGEKKKFITGR